MTRSRNSKNRSPNISTNNLEPPLSSGIVIWTSVFKPNIYPCQSNSYHINFIVAGPLKRRNVIHDAQNSIPDVTLSTLQSRNLPTPFTPCTCIYNILVLSYIVIILICFTLFFEVHVGVLGGSKSIFTTYDKNLSSTGKYWLQTNHMLY